MPAPRKRRREQCFRGYPGKQGKGKKQVLLNTHSYLTPKLKRRKNSKKKREIQADRNCRIGGREGNSCCRKKVSLHRHECWDRKDTGKRKHVETGVGKRWLGKRSLPEGVGDTSQRKRTRKKKRKKGCARRRGGGKKASP